MKVNLTKDEIEFLIRSIDLAWTFAISHRDLINKNWRVLEVDKDELIGRLKKEIHS